MFDSANQSSNLNLLNRISGPNSLSLPAWLLTLPGAIVTPLLTTSRTGQVLNWKWLILGGLGHLIFGAVLCVARFLKKKFLFNQKDILTYVAIITVAAISRGLFIGLAGFHLHLASSTDLIFRLSSAPATMLVWYSIASLLVDSSRKHREAMELNKLELNYSRNLAEKSAQLIKDHYDESISQIRRVVSDQLLAARELSTFPVKAADHLNRVIDDVVRPLSKRLSSQSKLTEWDFINPSIPEGKIGTPWREYLKYVVCYKPLDAKLSTAIIFLTSLFLTLSVFGLKLGAICLFIQSITSYLSIRFASNISKVFGIKTINNPHLSLILFSWIFLSLINSGVVSAIMKILYQNQTHKDLLMYFWAPSIWFLISICSQLAAAATHAITSLRDKAEQDLLEETEIVKLATARLKQRAWSNEKQLSHILHGEIQSRIVATALQLHLAESNDASAIITKLNFDLEKTLFKSQLFSWSESLKSLTNLWQYAIELVINISEEARMVLESDSDVANSTIEVLREAITNSVRHGNSDQVVTQIDYVDGRIRLVVRDDGIGLPTKLVQGEGSKILDALCLNWSIEGAPGAVLIAEIVASVEKTTRIE